MSHLTWPGPWSKIIHTDETRAQNLNDFRLFNSLELHPAHRILENISDLTLASDKLDEIVKQEHVYEKRAKEDIYEKFYNVLSPLNPYKPWTEDVILKVLDSNNLKYLKSLHTIIRRHARQLKKSRISKMIKSEIGLGSLFCYFSHKKSTFEEFKFLLKFCDLKSEIFTEKGEPS